MRSHDRHVTRTAAPRRYGSGADNGPLAWLHELDDYQVARGQPDVRGWTVRTPDSREVGKVDNLIVDLGALEVSYLEIALDRDSLRLARPRKVLVPIGLVWLDEARKIVCLGLGAGELIAGQCARAARRLATT